jgi:Flp pilus assembly protein TadD
VQSAFDMKPLRFHLLLLITCAISSATQGQTASKASEVRAHLSRGEAALRANNPAAAEGEFRDALAIDPRNAEANSNLGVLEYARGDYRHACENFREALTRQPSLIKAEALLGLCETKIGDQASAKHLEDSFAKLQDAKLRTQVGLELVGMYYASGETERAVAVTQKLVDLNPEDPDLLYAAQRLYNELADATLNKLAIVAPNSARMQQVMAERLINAGDLQPAIDHYKKALELDPHLPGIRYELAQSILETSRFDTNTQASAMAQTEEAQRLEGDNANLQCLLARIASLKNDDASANQHYRQALTLDPGNTEAQVGLARILMATSNFREARKLLEMAVDSDPLNNTAHYRLAMVDKKLGLEAEAQKEARLAQEIKATHDNVQRLYLEMHKQSPPRAESQEE